MRIFTYILLLIIVILGISFAVLNAETVTLNYYIGHRSISLSLLLALCFGIGVLIGLILALFPILRLKRVNYRLKSQIKSFAKADV